VCDYDQCSVDDDCANGAVCECGGPRLTELRDDESFATAHVDLCSVPKGADGCDGIEEYLSAFPNGRHAAEARSAQAKSAGTIARLRAQAQARAAAEAKAAQAREAAEARASQVRAARSQLFARFDCEHLRVIQSNSGLCPGSFYVACDRKPDDLGAIGCKEIPLGLCCSAPP
jgi:hypothetical protein